MKHTHVHNEKSVCVCVKHIIHSAIIYKCIMVYVNVSHVCEHVSEIHYSQIRA